MRRVGSNSPEEHLQPFRDKMEAFVLSGESSKQMNADIVYLTASKRTRQLLKPVHFSSVLHVTPIFVGFTLPPAQISQSFSVSVQIFFYLCLEGWVDSENARRSDKDQTDLAASKTHRSWDKVI